MIVILQYFAVDGTGKITGDLSGLVKIAVKVAATVGGNLQ